MKNEKDWQKWLFWFSFAVASISIYKLLDNFTDILNAVQSFISLLKPFILAAILAYLLYIPCKKIEDTFNNTKSQYLQKKRIAGKSYQIQLIKYRKIHILSDITDRIK